MRRNKWFLYRRPNRVGGEVGEKELRESAEAQESFLILRSGRGELEVEETRRVVDGGGVLVWDSET